MIEQFGMRRRFTYCAKVINCADQSCAEDTLPDAVDQHTGDDRLFAAGEPPSQAKPVARRILRERIHCLEHIRLQRLTGGQVVLTTVEQPGFARLGQVPGDERGGESCCRIGALLDELLGFGLQTKLGQAALWLGQVCERLTRLGFGFS